MSARPDVYGKYSLGSGAILANPDKVWSDLADPEVLASYEKSMRTDMEKSGIAPSRFMDWHVMDVGTGRQALTFLKFGAKRVSHFDISAENVERVRAYAAEYASGRLETTCCDLVETDLGRERYDLVYLNGIVQHFSDVGRGIAHCIRALKPGGYLWLYFYRSGTFDNFVAFMLRDLAYNGSVVTDNNLMRDYFVASRLFYSSEVRSNYLTSIFMDGIFTRYAQLFTPATYLAFAYQCGLEVVSTSGIDPLGSDVDHVFARAATVVTFKKLKAVPGIEIDKATALLSPDKGVNQLDRSHYSDSQILRSIDLYQSLKTRLSSATVPDTQKMLTVMRLFASLAQTRAPGFDPLQRHTLLQQNLQTCHDLIAEEYEEGA